MAINFDRALGLHPQALQLAARRAELLANNIANSDTPGYQAQDIDFSRLLAQQDDGRRSTSGLLRTRDTHLSVGGAEGFDQQVAYRQPLQPSIDGNSVDLQTEQAEFAKNLLHYQTSLTLLRGRFDGLSRAIKESEMSLGQIFDIAGSAMSAQTVRLNTTSSNLANADSASSSIDRTYRARHPVFSAVQQQVMEQGLFGEAAAAQAGVEVAGIVESQAPLQPRYQPEHPMADQDGYVYYPNVNPIEEMADMISASRSYQVNVEMMNTAKEMIVQTLKLGG